MRNEAEEVWAPETQSVRSTVRMAVIVALPWVTGTDFRRPLPLRCRGKSITHPGSKCKQVEQPGSWLLGHFLPVQARRRGVSPGPSPELSGAPSAGVLVLFWAGREGEEESQPPPTTTGLMKLCWGV